MTLEEWLSRTEERLAALRYLADSAALNPNTPDERVLSGMGTLLGEIEAEARYVRRSMPVKTGETFVETSSPRK